MPGPLHWTRTGKYRCTNATPLETVHHQGRTPGAEMVTSVYDPGCVKTLRGINAPEIFGSVVMRRAKKCKNLFRSALRPNQIAFSHDQGRVEMWRGCCRLNISVSAPFVWRCLNGSAVAPFPHSAHRTGRADFPHPALGQDLTPLSDA